jgi:hypothetical protein
MELGRGFGASANNIADTGTAKGVRGSGTPYFGGGVVGRRGGKLAGPWLKTASRRYGGQRGRRVVGVRAPTIAAGGWSVDKGFMGGGGFAFKRGWEWTSNPQ